MPLTAQGLCTNCGAAASVHALGGLCPACVSQDIFGDFLEGEEAPAEALGHIGSFRLIEEIGEGGFAVVYRAEQSQPVRREVALKVIKKGMDTRQVIARFEAERQAVAMMDHPDIATVFDAGTTDDGRPYFAMELVKGQPVTEFATARTLDRRARLELVVRICDAVEHAHRRGVIHRDLKPSNILVGDQQLKVIDFGIAKATEHLLTESTLMTAGGQLLGTPGYMSPEQATLGRADVDTRTDVYALGIVLYELLADRPAWSRETLNGLPVDQLLALLREGEPPRPSKHAPDLPADLDWITARATAKERERRYGSAAELGADLKRFLDGEPIVARPPSTAYRIGKFVRRNKLAVALCGLVAIAVVVGSVASTLFAIKAERGRAEADAAKRETRISYSAADLGMAREAAAAGREAEGIAYLCRALRTDPDNHAAAQTLLHELVYRGFPQSAAAPHSIGRAARSLHPLADRKTLVVSADGRATLDQQEIATGVDRVCARPGGQGFALRLRDAGWQVFGNNAVARPDLLAAGADHVALSRDGTILTSLFAGALTRWGERTEQVSRIGAAPTAIAIAPTRENAVAGFANGRLIAFNTATGATLAELALPDGRAVAGLSTARSRLIAFGKNARTAFLFKLGTNDAPTAIDLATPVEDVAIGPLGERCALLSGGTLHLFKGGDAIAQIDGVQHSPRFSPSGDLLAADLGDGRLGLFLAETGEVASMPMEHARELADHAYLPSGELRSITETGTLHRWLGQRSLPDLVRFEHGETPYLSVFFFHPGDSIHTLDLGGTYGNFSPTDGFEHSFYSDHPFVFPVLPIHLTPEGNLLYLKMLPDLAEITPETEIAFGVRSRFLQIEDTIFHRGISTGMINDPGSLAAIGDHSGAVTLYDIEKAAPIHRWELGDRSVTNSVSVAGGRYLLAANETDRAYLLQLAPPYRKIALEHDAPIASIATHPDGKIVATGSIDNSARLWHVADGTPATAPLRHDEIASSSGIIVKFSPDGSKLITGGSGDFTARVWDTATGKLAIDPLPHDGVVQSFDWGPKLDRLVTCCDDGYTRLWDARSGGLLAPPLPHPGPARTYDAAHPIFPSMFQLGQPIQFVHFDAHSGRRMLAAASFGGVEVYELAPAEPTLEPWFLDFAEALAGKRFNDRGVTEAVPYSELAGWRTKLSSLPLEEGSIGEQTAAWLITSPASRPRTPLAPWRSKGPAAKYRPHNPPWHKNEQHTGFSGEE